MTRKRNFFSGVGRLALLLLFLALPSALAKNLPIAWDANLEPDLAGYNVYYGELTQEPQTLTVTSPEAVLPNLVPGRTYAIYVTAFNSLGIESAPSETITYTVPGHYSAVTSIKNLGSAVRLAGIGLPGETYLIEAAEDLKNPVWSVVSIAMAGTDGHIEVLEDGTLTMRFFRMVHVAAPLRNQL